jgi:hypothetical protein
MSVSFVFLLIRYQELICKKKRHVENSVVLPQAEATGSLNIALPLASA